MYFEDIKEGYTWVTEPKIVTQDMIERFADLTGDHNPLHLDEHIAERGPFHGIVSHGRLTGDVAIGSLPYDLLEGMMLLEDSTQYKRPVRPGDHIHCVFSVFKKEIVIDSGFLHCLLSVLNQNDKVVAEIQFKVKATRRESQS